jgi:hypothetical protein
MTDRHFDRDEPRALVAPVDVVAPGPFKLYPEERHWWSMSDYGAVVAVMRRLQPKRVLEFGPGSSTLALIEGGAEHIHTLEDQPDWADVHETRLQAKFPDIVHLHRYTWAEPLTIPPVDGEHFDLALIDGPLGTDRRGEAVRYALARSRAVLAPTETKNPQVLEDLKRLAAEVGADMQVWETGPLSGGFALLVMPVPPAPPGEHAERTGGDATAPAVEERTVDPGDLSIPEVPDLQTPEGPRGMPVQTPSPAPLSRRQQKKQEKASKRS